MKFCMDFCADLYGTIQFISVESREQQRGAAPKLSPTAAAHPCHINRRPPACDRTTVHCELSPTTAAHPRHINPCPPACDRAVVHRGEAPPPRAGDGAPAS